MFQESIEFAQVPAFVAPTVIGGIVSLALIVMGKQARRVYRYATTPVYGPLAASILSLLNDRTEATMVQWEYSAHSDSDYFTYGSPRSNHSFVRVSNRKSPSSRTYFTDDGGVVVTLRRSEVKSLNRAARQLYLALQTRRADERLALLRSK